MIKSKNFRPKRTVSIYVDQKAYDLLKILAAHTGSSLSGAISRVLLEMSDILEHMGISNEDLEVMPRLEILKLLRILRNSFCSKEI